MRQVARVARDFRSILEEIGCWPPKCHACGSQIDPDGLMRFERTGAAVDRGAVLAAVHDSCGAPTQPTEEEKRGIERREGRGAFVTEDMLR